MTRSLVTVLLALLLCPGVALGQDAALSDAAAPASDLSAAPLGDWLIDQAEELGLAAAQPFRILVADVNNDGYPDLYFLNATASAQLFVNQQRPGSADAKDRVFVDFTADSGVTRPGPGTDPSRTERRTFSAAFADVDNDGDLDLFVGGVSYYKLESYTDYGDRCEIYLNDGKGHFTLKADSGLHEAGPLNVTGATFVDYDLDGNVDLYLGMFFKDYTKNILDTDRLYRGIGDGTFVDVTAASQIGSRQGPTYGVNTADYNDDGWPDLIAANYCRGPSLLWKNNGDGTFTELGLESGFAKDMTKAVPQPACNWSAMPSDYDNDGDIDFLYTLTHGFEGASRFRTCPAVNSGASGKYTFDWRIEALARKQPTPSHHGDHYSGWIDLDNDGLSDAFITESAYTDQDRLYIFRQKPDHSFEEITADLGLMGAQGLGLHDPHPAVRVDYDLDGDDDLLVGFMDVTPNHLMAFRNNIGTKNRWIAVSLAPAAGSGVNRSAIGARVIVKAGDLTLTREVYAGEGNFAGQQPLRLTFGLGPRSSVDSISVRWPDKDRTVTSMVPDGVDRLVTIAFPGPSPDGGLDAGVDAGKTGAEPNSGNGGNDGCSCRFGELPSAEPLAAFLALLLLGLRAGSRKKR